MAHEITGQAHEITGQPHEITGQPHEIKQPPARVILPSRGGTPSRYKIMRHRVDSDTRGVLHRPSSTQRSTRYVRCRLI